MYPYMHEISKKKKASCHKEGLEPEKLIPDSNFGSVKESSLFFLVLTHARMMRTVLPARKCYVISELFFRKFDIFLMTSSILRPQEQQHGMM